MRPPLNAVAIDFGSPPGSPPSDEFEQVPYPPDHYKAQREQEQLPLHYMNEEKARRRNVRSGGELMEGAPGRGTNDAELFDDEGKDVYSKLRPTKARVGSGRIQRPPPPPPTTIVSAFSSPGKHIL